jgi:preprotein translocase SecE subunit
MDETGKKRSAAAKGPRKPKAEKKNMSADAQAAAAPRPARPAGTSPFRLYKPGQGLYVRWGTTAGAGLVAMAGTSFLRGQMTNFTQLLWVQTLVPVALMVVLAYVIFRLVGQARSPVDFMIATEGEMKKVNWSTRREVMGATRVVIVTLLALGTVLFMVDLIFMAFFETIGVLKIPMLSSIFGFGGES